MKYALSRKVISDRLEAIMNELTALEPYNVSPATLRDALDRIASEVGDLSVEVHDELTDCTTVKMEADA